MNALIPGRDPSTLTMSSREIADLTGKDHKNVIRDIRVILKELHGDGSDLSHQGIQVVTDDRGYTSEIRLPRREVEILVTGYSITLRAKVIDRLHELEAAAQKPAFTLPDFTNPAEAAEAWAFEYRAKSQLAIENTALLERVEALQPKAAALTTEQYADYLRLGGAPC